MTIGGEPLLISLRKAAELLGLSEWQTRQLVDSGVIPSTRVSNRIYLPAEALRDYVTRISESA